jgi:uncharacterized protein (TIGR01777 family)
MNAKLAQLDGGLPPGATIGLTGASGLVGQAICQELEGRGYQVVRYSRSGGTEATPGVRKFSLDAPVDFSGIDGVVHLAGESIHGIWTREKKRRIWDSRIEGTRRVVEGIERAGGVRVLLGASAIGFYGFVGEEAKGENAPAGSGFLAELSQAWEVEARRAEGAGCRVAAMRIGLVLGPPAAGGALKVMVPIFRLGLGGRLGSGKQWMSAIHRSDLAAAAAFLLGRGDLAGPFNVVMPKPVTNADFTKILARTLHRPAPWVVPAPILRVALGGLSDLLLGEAQIVPTRLLEAGFAFRFPSLAPALQDALGE